MCGSVLSGKHAPPPKVTEKAQLALRLRVTKLDFLPQAAPPLVAAGFGANVLRSLAAR